MKSISIKVREAKTHRIDLLEKLIKYQEAKIEYLIAEKDKNKRLLSWIRSFNNKII
jgi:hypothetical protein